jgi:hypothetical protein
MSRAPVPPLGSHVNGMGNPVMGMDIHFPAEVRDKKQTFSKVWICLFLKQNQNFKNIGPALFL